jgi:peptide/nickel transport system ATP-binding protein
MREGQIVEQGPRDRVLRRPQHPYTQMLIAAVPSLSPKLRAARASREVVLATRGLSKTYGSKGLFGRGREVHAANDVTLELRRGETLGIVGESGSGKSTVARCVLRLVDPTAGGIELDGVDIARMRAGQLRKHRRQIQIVFQDPYRSLNPRRAVGASIVEGPMNFGIAREEARRRAGDLMELVGLERAALSRFPHQFSGGQRQRICIARALAMEPSVLVADEPVSALDVSVQAQVLRLLDDVRRRFNLAMMFITHDLRVAAQVCDRIAVMHQGNVVEHGDVREVFTAPKHPYTRELLAGAPGKDFDFGRFDFETAEQAAARQSAGSHG